MTEQMDLVTSRGGNTEGPPRTARGRRAVPRGQIMDAFPSSLIHFIQGLIFLR